MFTLSVFFFSAFRESSLCFFCSFSFSSWDSQRIISWLLHDCNHRSSVLDVISFIERVCVFFFFFFILNLFLRVPNIATVSEIAFKRSVCVCVCVCRLGEEPSGHIHFYFKFFFFFLSDTRLRTTKRGREERKKENTGSQQSVSQILRAPLSPFFFFLKPSFVHQYLLYCFLFFFSAHG